MNDAKGLKGDEKTGLDNGERHGFSFLRRWRKKQKGQKLRWGVGNLRVSGESKKKDLKGETEGIG